MALDLSDLYLIHAIDDRNDTRTRAKNIEDNFGVKAMEVGEFRERNGGFGIMKALAVAVGVGLAVGLLVAAIPAIASAAVVVGLGTGIFAGKLTMAKQNERVMKEYSGYLDSLSASARASRDRGISQEAYYDNGAGRRRTWAAELDERSAQPALQGGRN